MQYLCWWPNTIYVTWFPANGIQQKTVALEIKSRVSENTVKTAEDYKKNNDIANFTDLHVKSGQTQSIEELKKHIPDPTHVAQV